MKRYRIDSTKKIRLRDFDPEDTGDFSDDAKGQAECESQVGEALSRLDDLQGRLYASRHKAILIVLQGMDTAGKDGTIRKVMGGFNPIGCVVESFKVPTEWELAHDYLWRVYRVVPPKGYVGIFNRSHYEDVLVTRVHGLVSKEVCKRRFEEIRNFEKHLADNGTVILKFFLHISKDEQKERLQERIDTPDKRWKFNLGDLKERKLWDDYQKAYEDAIGATGTEEAPWYVVPADHKWYRNWVVSRILCKTLGDLNLKYPVPPKEINFRKIRVK
ncbi:MAG TPA: polyphosphate kinase 2 family protein [bacterium]|nr:polyphosphate kinase 2 family protein [bacterium]